MVKRGIARLDERAVGEMDLVEVSGHARPDVYLIDRLEAADEVVPLLDVLHHRLRDAHLRRRPSLREGRRGETGQERGKGEEAGNGHGRVPGRGPTSRRRDCDRAEAAAQPSLHAART
jgi:hypothetical protein